MHCEKTWVLNTPTYAVNIHIQWSPSIHGLTEGVCSSVVRVFNIYSSIKGLKTKVWISLSDLF